MVSILLQTSFSLYISGLFSLETYAFSRVVGMASFFYLVIIIPLNSWPRRRLLHFSVRIPPHSRFLVLVCRRSLLHSRRSEDTYNCRRRERRRGSHCHVDVHVTSSSRSRYETCSVTDKTSPCCHRRRHFCHSVTRALGTVSWFVFRTLMHSCYFCMMHPGVILGLRGSILNGMTNVDTITSK